MLHAGVSQPIVIDIWSDIACPWCYIGKRNLERALETLAGEPDVPRVVTVFHSFELAADTPVDFAGDEVDFLSEHKGMPRQQVEQMLARVSDAARGVGLDFRFDRVQHTNTLLAHQLLHFAKAQGRQLEMAERLMAAYFVEGAHLGRPDELVRLAVDVGLDGDETRAALESERFLPDVRQDQQQARTHGIQGVPFFVIDGQYGVSGAQPSATFEGVLRDLWSQRGAAADATPTEEAAADPRV